MAQKMRDRWKGWELLAKAMDGDEEIPLGMKTEGFSRDSEFTKAVDLFHKSFVVSMDLNSAWWEGGVAVFKGVIDKKKSSSLTSGYSPKTKP
jgi:hypothetical protein